MGILSWHIAVRIQRGGGIWPCETPATSRKGTVPIPSGSNYKAWEMWTWRFRNVRLQTPAEVFSHMPPESLSCKECRTTYPLEARYVCEQCFGPLEVAYAPRSVTDPSALRRRIQAGPHSLWRYTDFLPVAAPPKGTQPAGWTPLLRVDRLAEALGLREVWIKNDAANPTHSFKDRVVSVAMARARELGFQTVACASTGNLANAVAAHAAAAGLESFAFVPALDMCQPVKPETIAKSLAIGDPADGPYALDLARRTGGSIDSVSDEEIREGIRLLAQTTGIFTEAAGGVTVAVLAKLARRGDIDPSERVVTYITGEGLKTLDCARGTFEAWQIEPTIESFEAAGEHLKALA